MTEKQSNIIKFFISIILIGIYTGTDFIIAGILGSAMLGYYGPELFLKKFFKKGN